jgi:Small Multidrug Resistance protein
MKNEKALMAWLFILMADVFELAWPFALKWSVKFSTSSHLIVAIVTSIPVMFLLAEVVKRLPVATVYAGMRVTQLRQIYSVNSASTRQGRPVRSVRETGAV